MSSLKDSKALRWAAPVGAIAIVGAAIGAGPVIAAAKGNPSLPPRTAAQLLAAVDQATHTGKPPAFSGTVVESASLGLPQLPDIGRAGASSSLTSLLAGSNTVRLWYQDQQHARFALLGTGSETDVILNGQNMWEWSSTQNTATHSVLTPDKAHPAKPQTAKPKTPLTPQQAANEALAEVGKNTTVSVDPTARVAGRAAYQLVLAPKDANSLVGEVRIALDGQNYVPLRVQVFARGASSPAVQVGLTQVTFSTPAAANFNFTPPSGAKVVQKTEAPKSEAPKIAKPFTKGTPAVTGEPTTPAASAGRKTIGSGWTTVIEMPMTAAQAAPAPQKGGSSTDSRMLQSILKSATQVKGSWGSGRLLTTKLVSALLTDDGRLFVGAVTPSVLEQAAAQK